MNPNPSIEHSQKVIGKLYDNLGYFDLYFGSVFQFILLTFTFIVLIMYFYVMSNLSSIRNDWVVQRCKPYIIPIAGLVNAGVNGNTDSVSDYTTNNMHYCFQQMLTHLYGAMQQPFEYLISLMHTIFNDIEKSLQNIRIMIKRIRERLTAIIEEIFGKMMNLIVPIQQMIIGFKDMMAKIVGILITGMFFAEAIIDALQSGLDSMAQAIFHILVYLGAVILVFWIIPFMETFAAILTVIYISISIPLGEILHFLVDDMHMSLNIQMPKMPKKPGIHHCFSAESVIAGKRVCDVRVGDRLGKSGIINAVLILNGFSESCLFEIQRGVWVSGSHPLYLKKENTWILVQHFATKMKMNMTKRAPPVLYCFVTSTGYIYLDDDDDDEKEEEIILSDWTERIIVTDNSPQTHDDIADVVGFDADVVRNDLHFYKSNFILGIVLLKDSKVQFVSDSGIVLLNGKSYKHFHL